MKVKLRESIEKADYIARRGLWFNLRRFSAAGTSSLPITSLQKMPYALTPYPVRQSTNGALDPEVIDPRIADVEALARWLDYAFVIPGGFRYGLGGFIGLIPGIGDILDALLSLYIVGRAVQLGIPRVTLARMVLNIGIESIGGSLPFAGALFDTVFKANRRNYQLLRSHLTGSRNQSARDWAFLAVTILLVALGIAIPVVLLMELLKHL